MGCSYKKLILILLLALTGVYSYGQELTAVIANNIKYGRTEYLEQYSTASAINDCMGVGNSKKYNLLAISIKLKSIKSLKFFVEKGADLENVCDDKTPLMYAAKYGQLEMFKYLVEQGADMDVSLRGSKAMSYARRFNNRDIVKYIKGLKTP